MSIYIAIYILIFLFAVLERIDDENEVSAVLVRKQFFFLIAAVLCLFGSLRYYSGFDYENYKVIYELSSRSGDGTRFEPGYMFLQRVFKFNLGFSYRAFLFFLTGIAILSKSCFFFKYFKYPTFLFIIYFPSVFLYADFGQVRQGVAVGIFLWAIPAIANRQLLRFLVIWLLSVSFHYSALFFFPVYWLYKITVGRKLFLTVFITGFIFNAFLGARILFSAAATLFQGSSLGALLQYMAVYNGEDSNVSALSYLTDINTLLVIPLILLYQNIYQKEIITREESHMEFSAYNVYIICFLMVKFFSSVSIIGYRGAYFYKTIEPILFYYFCYGLKEKELKMLLFAFLFLYGLIRLIFIIEKQAWQFVPYQMSVDLLGF